MSTFKWEVSEPAQDDAESGLQSGTVQLDAIKLSNGVSLWRVEARDSSVALVPQPSGEIDLAGNGEIGSGISRGVVNFALIVTIFLLGFIVVHDVIIGHLTFENLFAMACTLLVGFGFGVRKAVKSKPVRKRAGSLKKP